MNAISRLPGANLLYIVYATHITPAAPYPTHPGTSLTPTSPSSFGRANPRNRAGTANPSSPTVPIMFGTDTPADFASDFGNDRLNIIAPYKSTGTKNTPSLISQAILFSGVSIWPNTNPATAPRMRPSGHPAWRMFSQCVLFRGK